MELYTTRLARTSQLGNGIYKETWMLSVIDDIPLLEEHFDITFENIGHQTGNLMLMDVSQVKKMSKAARDFLGNYSRDPKPIASALLVNSSLSKVIGTLFLKFNSPQIPMKLFTDEQKAIDWLLAQQK